MLLSLKMQGQSRNSRSASYDPFQGFGIAPIEFGGRNADFPGFFDRDPFDDPFFKEPLGKFFGSSSGFFGPPSGVLRRIQGGDPTDGMRSTQQQGRRGPVIEELSGDQESSNPSHAKSIEVPIVEHPDDENEESDDLKRYSSAYVRNRDIDPKHDNYLSSYPKCTSQSYSFSSVTYGGPGGTYYKSSTARRAGADGVVEEEHEEHDSTTRQETKRLSRGLWNKGHSVTRKRYAEGSENYVETLHNLTEEEKNDFDEDWRRQAEKSLPGWNNSRGQVLQRGHSDTPGSGKQSRAALPSNKESSWRWPWAKQA